MLRLSRILLGCAALLCLAAEQPDPHWSAVTVRVLDDSTKKPVAGARIEQTCKGCAYVGDRVITDTNGVARVMIYDRWIALRISRDGFMDGSVSLYGTNAVGAFRSKPVITLKTTKK
jgi:hypothetical protein